MSQPLNNYTFLSYFRKGIINSINALPDSTQMPQRAQLQIDVQVNTEVISKTVQLIGPQDVLGFNSNMIVRTEPRHWITDFEPNYLPFVEFYEEDFPWRYTPVQPDNNRLFPWIALVILSEDEFEMNDTSIPLPSFKLKKNAKDVFPPFDQMWAWAHVHVNKDISAVTTDETTTNLNDLLSLNPDNAFSRLICPRRLKANTAYHAFIIPAFESGRLTGLGMKLPSTLDYLESSWKNPNDTFPVYYRWFFRTGDVGDFEYLLSRLEARTADKRLGLRDMDMQTPGFGTTWTDDQLTLLMEGALISPSAKPSKWPVPPIPLASFQEKLQELINLPDTITTQQPTSDPVVSVPFYGNKHALQKRITITNDETKDNWITNLNADPRYRGAAGLGTLVVQKNQETYMRSAWEQVKNVNEANQKIKYGQFAIKVGAQIFTKYLSGLSTSKSVLITAPVHKKILGSPVTIHQLVKGSILPISATSGSFRKITRPNGVIVKRSGAELEEKEDLVAQINSGKITATPVKPFPEKSNNLKEVGDIISSSTYPQWINTIVSKIHRGTLIAILLVIALLAMFTANFWILLVAIVTATVVYRLYARVRKKLELVKGIHDQKFTSASVDQISSNSNFKILNYGEEPASASFMSVLSEDSTQAVHFKSALKNMYAVFEQQPPVEPMRSPLALTTTQQKIVKAIDPHLAISKRIVDQVKWGVIPSVQQPEEDIVPVMAYPDFEDSMYAPLRDISTDYLCPNVKLIPQNTISLLETNEKFIESYMVGLNHEMGRELLWRAYPTDQRGSYFRQFWDVKDFVPLDSNLTKEQLTEKLKDIKPIHTWGKSSMLGDHNNREEEGDKTQLVLVIRSDLFKRYPNTIVFAQRAKWVSNVGGDTEIDESLTVIPGQNYDTNLIKLPLYKAEVLPDIKFLGFDLTVPEAKGDATDPGWYFVIMERPGEPRFGMDEPTPEETYPLSAIEKWNDLEWGHLVNSSDALNTLSVIDLTKSPPSLLPLGNINLSVPPRDQDDVDQIKEDHNYTWGSNAAGMAYILFQAPVKVAVHAKEMLEGV